MGCVSSIKKVLEEITGVIDFDVSLKEKQAKIQYDPEKTDTKQFKEAIVKQDLKSIFKSKILA